MWQEDTLPRGSARGWTSSEAQPKQHTRMRPMSAQPTTAYSCARDARVRDAKPERVRDAKRERVHRVYSQQVNQLLREGNQLAATLGLKHRYVAGAWHRNNHQTRCKFASMEGYVEVHPVSVRYRRRRFCLLGTGLSG